MAPKPDTKAKNESLNIEGIAILLVIFLLGYRMR
jgi:hypothetical protein